VPHPKTADLEALLRALAAAGARFVLIGGGAAVVHGAPVTTQDLDIVPEQSPENIARLLVVLDDLDARFRPIAPGRDIPPTAAHLAGQGQLLLTTRLGPLDILCRLHDGRGYEALAATAISLEDDGLKLQVIDLDTLIEIKSSTGRAKDALVVPILRALRDRR
jgi:predicted nucleotidyltransferase